MDITPENTIAIAPEYFPGLETMAQIGASVNCVLLDTNQYSRQSFQNRSKLRNADGWQWISVPIQGGMFGNQICETLPVHPREWRKKHLKGLRYNYATTPFYEHYIAEIEQLLAAEYQTLSELTCSTLTWCAGALDLDTRFVRSSQTASSSVLPSASPLFPDDLFAWSYEHPTYRQNYDGFIAGMSVLDLLFNHGPDSKRVLFFGVQ